MGVTLELNGEKAESKGFDGEVSLSIDDRQKEIYERHIKKSNKDSYVKEEFIGEKTMVYVSEEGSIDSKGGILALIDRISRDVDRG